MRVVAVALTFGLVRSRYPRYRTSVWCPLQRACRVADVVLSQRALASPSGVIVMVEVLGGGGEA